MKKCRSKACWELLELVEKQNKIIKKLTMRNRELESIIEAEVQQ